MSAGFPLVSIAMPVLNEAKILDDVFAAILAQTYRNVEFLVGDNASDDGTQEICKRWAERDTRIKYERYEERAIPQINFNRLLPRASGKYFCWSACDDERRPEYVEKLVAALEAKPTAVVAFCRYANIDAAGQVIKVYDHDWPRILRGSRFRQFAAFLLANEAKTQKANFIYGMLRTDAIRDVGGIAIHEKSYSGADVLTLSRLLARGPFTFVDETLFFYRVRALVLREDQPVMSYMRRRIRGRVPGHSSNLVHHLVQHHEFHMQLRRFALLELPLGFPTRIFFWLAIWCKEILSLLLHVPAAVAKELRLVGNHT